MLVFTEAGSSKTRPFEGKSFTSIAAEIWGTPSSDGYGMKITFEIQRVNFEFLIFKTNVGIRLGWLKMLESKYSILTLLITDILFKSTKNGISI